MPPTRAEPDTASGVTTVVVVDDRPVVRAGILHALSDAPSVRKERIDAEEGDLAEAGLLVDKHQPQAVVVVLRGDDPEPYRTIATAKGLRENVHVLALVDEVTGPDLREAVIAGADGFLLTSAPLAELRQAVAAIARGDRIVSPEVAMHLVGAWRPEGDEKPRATVTARELDVLELLANGMTNREIAEALGVSPRTVKTHVQNLLTKLDVPDRTGAVARAFRLGLIR